MNRKRDLKVHMIPLDQIVVLNSRTRGQEKFRQIVSNISNIGLKKPVTVAPPPPPVRLPPVVAAPPKGPTPKSGVCL